MLHVRQSIVTAELRGPHGKRIDRNNKPDANTYLYE